MDYKKRLLMPITGSTMNLFTKTGFPVAKGYIRVVIGKRGPYIEFSDEQILKENLYIPMDQKWRFLPKYDYCFYYEWRTKEDNVKVYQQKRIVDYADYKIGLWYISPFDLLGENQSEIITK